MDRKVADENMSKQWEVLVKFDVFRLKINLKKLSISARKTPQKSPKPPSTRAHWHHVTYILAIRM